MTNQIIAYGATVERSLDGTDFEKIPECKSIAVPQVTQEYPEVTSLDSEDGYREYVKGLKDAGEITLTCGYTADGFEQQSGDNAAPDAIHYRVTLKAAPNQASGDVFTFRGYPIPALVDNGLGEPVDMTVTVRTTGTFTWTRGAIRA
ncbi:phage tail tube protein [Haematobacter massiliensis]|uniref:phage tail tube protein n=1 Tax=Haematobacter massiliensis TaxID=195105 RepID=UPI0023EF849E|nr:phage tail tube protein [Haematobacter massiliensis]